MGTVNLCRPLAKKGGKQSTSPGTNTLEGIPQAALRGKVGGMILPDKDQPQKITDLLADMIACNTEVPCSQHLTDYLEHGRVEEPWTRDVPIKPDLPPSDREQLLSRHSSQRSLLGRASNEEDLHKGNSSSQASFVQDLHKGHLSSQASLPSTSAGICVVAAAADAELRAVQARQESGQDAYSELHPASLYKLGNQAAEAASRLRGRLLPQPHPPLHLPQPMRMHPKPAADATADTSALASTIEFSRSSTIGTQDDLHRSRRAAEVTLQLPNPLSAASLRKLGSLCEVGQRDEDEDDVSDDDSSPFARASPYSATLSPSALRGMTDVFGELAFGMTDSLEIATARAVPRLLKKTRKEQEEVAEALHALEENLDGVAHADASGMHRGALRGHKEVRHRLSVMLGLHGKDSTPRHEPSAPSLLVSGTSSSRRSSADVPDMLRKAELTIDETEEESPSILENITLHSDREERLERLRKLTTLHRSSNRRHWDGISRAERERFQEVFQRYDYNRSGGLDVVEMHDALADLGLKPTTKKEKVDLARKAANQEGHEFDFKQFCRIVAQRRRRAVQAHRSHLKRLFDQYDTDHSGSLSADELLEVFNGLNLHAQQEDERIAFLNAVIECDVNGSGEIEWEEFEPLVQRVREKLGECHREREVRMREQMKLPPDIFLNFRSQLIPFHETFRKHEQDGSGTVCVSFLSTLAVDLGLAKDPLAFMDTWEHDEILKNLLDNRNSIDFAIFLQVAQRLRDLREGRGGQNLRRIFDMYDVDNSGDLSIDEIFRLMRDLGFEIQTSLKQEVRRLFEESDIDGSGMIEYREFTRFFHGACEMLQQKQYEEEQRAAEELGFTTSELRDLREVFHMLDHDNAGSLKFTEAMQALTFMGQNTATEQGLKKYDRFHLGRLDFISFLKAMNDINPSLAGSTGKRHAVAVPKLPKSSRDKSPAVRESRVREMVAGFGT